MGPCVPERAVHFWLDRKCGVKKSLGEAFVVGAGFGLYMEYKRILGLFKAVCVSMLRAWACLPRGGGTDELRKGLRQFVKVQVGRG